MQRSATQPGGRSRRGGVRYHASRWVVLFGLVVVAFIGTVTTLNLTLYSASGFTSSYLDALARHDVQGALGFPGVQAAAGGAPNSALSARVAAGSSELLVPPALAELTGIRLLSDTATAPARHQLEYQYSIDHVTSKSTFVVEHTGARLGFFSGWRFVESPLATLSITPRNGAHFAANGVSLFSSSGAGMAHGYRVLVPSAVTLSYSSTYLAAPPQTVLVTQATSAVEATVDIRANTAFTSAVSHELDRYLAACVTQKVLLPTGCPMGKQIGDRLQDAPTWTMVTYPVVTIGPGTAPNTWQMPPTSSMAHLVVKVRSIFDGSLSTVNVDVPFSVQYLITFGADGSPTITAQY